MIVCGYIMSWCMKSQHKSSILCWQMCRFVRLPRLLIETKVCQVQVAMNHKAAVHMTCFQSLAENKKNNRQSRPVKTPRVATALWWKSHLSQICCELTVVSKHLKMVTACHCFLLWACNWRHWAFVAPNRPWKSKTTTPCHSKEQLGGFTMFYSSAMKTSRCPFGFSNPFQPTVGCSMLHQASTNPSVSEPSRRIRVRSLLPSKRTLNTWQNVRRCTFQEESKTNLTNLESTLW